MARLFNKKTDEIPQAAIYIGRGSKWGNPFVVGVHGNRQQVIDKYREFIEIKYKLKEDCKKELKDKDLVCWCSPLACHGEILREIAND